MSAIMLSVFIGPRAKKRYLLPFKSISLMSPVAILRENTANPTLLSVYARRFVVMSLLPPWMVSGPGFAWAEAYLKWIEWGCDKTCLWGI